MKSWIIGIIIVVIIAGIIFGLNQCQSCQMGWKDLQSGTTGISREVTLYDANGRIINKWNGKFTIDTTDGIASFNIDGKRIILSGTYTVIEK